MINKQDVCDFLSFCYCSSAERGSSTKEMEKRYGFVYVDADNEGRGTYKRIKKKSFYWYRQVMRTNGEEIG